MGSPCDLSLDLPSYIHMTLTLYHMGANCQRIFNEITIRETHYNFRSPKLMKRMVNNKMAKDHFMEQIICCALLYNTDAESYPTVSLMEGVMDIFSKKR